MNFALYDISDFKIDSVFVKYGYIIKNYRIHLLILQLLELIIFTTTDNFIQMNNLGKKSIPFS